MTFSSSCFAPNTFALGANDVHVWRTTLDQPREQIESFWLMLADDEQARAKRFYFQRDRDHFIVGRGILRTILGFYLKCEPSCISFSYGSHGKPILESTANGDTIRFNVSHSNGMALYAFTRSREIGVDIEFIRSDLDVEQIAHRFFSPREIDALCKLPTHLRTSAFFVCWTRKEAYIKSRGEGLSLPLNQFDVSLTPGEPAALLSTRPDAEEAHRWSLIELNPAPGYVAALAVEGKQCELSYRQWPAEVTPNGERSSHLS